MRLGVLRSRLVVILVPWSCGRRPTPNGVSNVVEVRQFPSSDDRMWLSFPCDSTKELKVSNGINMHSRWKLSRSWYTRLLSPTSTKIFCRYWISPNLLERRNTDLYIPWIMRSIAGVVAFCFVYPFVAGNAHALFKVLSHWLQSLE
jgi:hypothetical protein